MCKSITAAYNNILNVTMNNVVINLFFSFLQTETLADHIKFDHGYTAKSPAIVNVWFFSP